MLNLSEAIFLYSRINIINQDFFFNIIFLEKATI